MDNNLGHYQPVKRYLVHAEFNYALVELDVGAGKERLVVAEDMVESIMSRYDVADYKLVGRRGWRRFKWSSTASIHSSEKHLPIILGEHVTTDAGTGAVHTAPDHGVDDFNVGRENGLGTLNLVQDNGVYSDAAGEFAGQHVYKVDASILAALEKHQTLVKTR
ncbi:class I tRNA ligase family protein [Paucibacter sp. O1-1]|nr:class I tRNA ligase family protein [Paucibacter sp. O1-1]MDA3827946.1 class I tRNA ligase family protein [Paucibacter sp. O1-1]